MAQFSLQLQRTTTLTFSPGRHCVPSSTLCLAAMIVPFFPRRTHVPMLTEPLSSMLVQLFASANTRSEKPAQEQMDNE